MSDKIYKRIIWFGVAVIMIFAPIARGAVRLWSITPIEVVVAILVFLWLWRVNNRETEDGRRETKKEKQSIRKTKIDLPLWLFVALAGTSGFFSIYKYVSILEMLRLVTIVGIFYLVVNNFERWMQIRLATLIIIMGSSISLFGLGQYFWGLNHSWWIPNMFLAATYVNHNHFAGYLELAIPLGLGMILGLKRDRFSSDFQLLSFRVGLITALLIMLAALVFSQSRGGWISLTISLIIMSIVLIKRGILRKVSLFIFLLLIALGVAYISGGYGPVSRRLHTVKEIDNEASLETRKKIWQGSIDMIKANPLIGTGIGTFVWGFPLFQPKNLAEVQAHYAHNDYLHMMAEMGMLALPLMLWMIWVVIRVGLKWTDFGLTGGMVLGSAIGILSLALHGLVDFNFHIPANMMVVASLAGIILRNADNRRFGNRYSQIKI